jgi:hypothetical protein
LNLDPTPLSRPPVENTRPEGADVRTRADHQNDHRQQALKIKQGRHFSAGVWKGVNNKYISEYIRGLVAEKIYST